MLLLRSSLLGLAFGVCVGLEKTWSVVSRLMSPSLSAQRRLELLEELPVASAEHAYTGAKRPLVVPLGDCVVCHVLTAGSVLREASSECASRVLGGRVRLVAARGQCACFGGDVCPRANCEWRLGEETRVAGSRAFEAARYSVVAEELSLVLDASSFSDRRANGALRVAPLAGPAAAAQKLWLLDDVAGNDQGDVMRKPAVYQTSFDDDRPVFNFGGGAEIPPPQQKKNDTTPKKKKKKTTPPTTTTRLDDGAALGVAGVDAILAELDTRLRLPLAAPPHLLAELGVAPVRGVMFHGAPGCGKTLLATSVAKALDSTGEPVLVAGPQLLDRYLGGSEENIRAAFTFDESEEENDASSSSEKKDATSASSSSSSRGAVRCVVVDEIDAIASKRSESGSPSGAERARDSIVNQLLSIMDGPTTKDDQRRFLVFATTNRLDLVDAALLRPGRFEIALEVTPPDAAGRRAILELHTTTARRHNRVTDRATHAIVAGFSDAFFPDGTTGATIASVVRLAASFALERFFLRKGDADAVQIDLPDLERAARRVIRSSDDDVALPEESRR